MKFDTEPKGYRKTALSDLQGAWDNLKEIVIEEFGFPDSDKLLFHINEAMSWESVRNLKKMETTLILIHNIAAQAKSSEKIIESIEEIRMIFTDTLKAVSDGDAE